MATIAKTAGIVALAHQAVTHPATVVGSAIDVSTKMAGTLIMFHANVESVTNTNPGSFLVQVSGSASGNEDWGTIAQFTAMATDCDTFLLDATEGVGDTVIDTNVTTGFAAGDVIYIQDVGTANLSEWNRCKSVEAGVSITLVDGLTRAAAINDVCVNDCDIFICALDLTAVTRIRVVFFHQGATGADCHVKALLVTGDSIG